MSQRSETVAALWEAMVARAEVMHETAVTGQRRADARVAGRVAALAQEVAVLAAAAQILRVRTDKRR